MNDATCPDIEAIRLRYALHGCRISTIDLGYLGRVPAVLAVERDGSGDLQLALNDQQPPWHHFAALSYVHRLLSDPNAKAIGIGWCPPLEDAQNWLLPVKFALSDNDLATYTDRAVVDVYPGGACDGQDRRCLSSTRAGGRCTRRDGWAGSGFCWQHSRQRAPWARVSEPSAG